MEPRWEEVSGSENVRYVEADARSGDKWFTYATLQMEPRRAEASGSGIIWASCWPISALLVVPWGRTWICSIIIFHWTCGVAGDCDALKYLPHWHLVGNLSDVWGGNSHVLHYIWIQGGTPIKKNASAVSGCAQAITALHASHLPSHKVMQHQSLTAKPHQLWCHQSSSSNGTHPQKSPCYSSNNNRLATCYWWDIIKLFVVQALVPRRFPFSPPPSSNECGCGSFDLPYLMRYLEHGDDLTQGPCRWAYMMLYSVFLFSPFKPLVRRVGSRRALSTEMQGRGWFPWKVISVVTDEEIEFCLFATGNSWLRGLNSHFRLIPKWTMIPTWTQRW